MKRRIAYPILLLAAAACYNSADTVAVEPDDVEPSEPIAGRVVVDDSRSWGSDSYVLNSAAIKGDELTVNVSYGGGCRTHVFTLVLSATFAESDPVQLSAELAHEASDDPCEAWLTEDYVFDLSLVKSRYRTSYGSGPAKVVLQIDGVSGDGLVYEFTS